MLKKEVDILHGKIGKSLFLFTLPIAFSGILQLLYNTADVIVVGRYAGSNSLAAVGSTISIVNLFISLFMGFSIGSNVCVAQYVGMGYDKAGDKIKKSVHTSVLMSIIFGIILSLVSVLLSRFIVDFMGTPLEIADEAHLYLVIIFLGFPALVIYNICSAVLRALGDSKTPFYILAITGLLNVLLNLFFVIVFKMKAEGVGIATALSQYVAAYMVIDVLRKLKTPAKLHLKDLKIDREIFIKIMKLGVPGSIQGVIFNISNLQVQSAVNGFGADAVAGNSSAFSIEGFIYMGAINAPYQAIITFIGQNVGANNYERVKKSAVMGFVETVIMCLAITFLFIIFARPVLNLYTPGEETVIRYGLMRLKYVSSLTVICCFMDISVAVLRGLGSSFAPMVLSIVGVCGFRMTWLLFVFPMYNTLESVYMCYPVSWTFTAIINMSYMVYFYRKKRREYEKNRISE